MFKFSLVLFLLDMLHILFIRVSMVLESGLKMQKTVFIGG
jgi:hypothetical protein